VQESTTVTVTSSKASPAVASTGSGVTFRAQVEPNLILPNTHITGTIDWTVVGNDGSTLTCARVLALRNSGRSSCIIAPGQLLAGASEYTATASYTGDTNFAPSSGFVTQAVNPKATSLLIRWESAPTSGAGGTVSATLRGGRATGLITGAIVFVVTGTDSRPTTCLNGSPVPHNPVAWSVALGSGGSPSNVAVCTVPAGWLVLPSAAPGLKHPKAFWTVTATYVGNDNFGGVIEKYRHGSIR
jgi:hypothetical protein